ncbi:IclR family transcriptional regulator [Halobellus salinisoli]|uniref:IclR family transcriptional regulator n=1 Tax=Halobellus salinisoli TaxID=3108500 RepID=UPI00300A99B0
MTGNLVGADETLFRIVEAMAGAGSMGVTEVATRLDLTKSTAHRHLQTLAAHGYAVNDGGTYRLSHQWFHLGTAVKSSDPFYLASRRELVVLADRTGKTVWGAVEEMGELMFVNGAGARPTHNPDLLIGNWSSITETAAGKAILAALSEERTAEIVENAGGEKSIEDIRTELEYVRTRGYATNLGERISGIYAMGMAVVVDDSVFGAISLSSSSDDLITTDREASVAALSEAVERVEENVSEHT